MLLIIPVLLPIIGGALEAVLPLSDRRRRSIYVGVITAVNSLVLAYLIVFCGDIATSDILMTEKLSFRLRMDGLSRVFSSLIAFLWPLASLYAFSYMEHERHEQRFFSYYTISYGVTCGIALAGNLFTLYVFYELLTLSTLPLVLHKLDAESVHAGRVYLYFSISGAAFAFIGMIVLLTWGVGNTAFVPGGVLSGTQADPLLIRIVYVMTFLGFGVKAAVFPLYAWLPRVSVAPTPVTALLHAVAVVKAGAFAVLRATYYGFGTELLRGTWAQYTVFALAAFTIVFGSAMALRERHLKRRLAYSTVSNLSYILLGAALMSPEGFTGSMLHMLFHGIIKITLFFCAGAILVRTGREYIQEIRGFGKLMPFTMTVFLIASAALVGVPPLPGFISKWALASAAVKEGGVLAACGTGALIVSAVLTACYLFPVAAAAWFRPVNEELSVVEGVNRDPDKRMLIPFAVLCAAIILLSFAGGPLTDALSSIAKGI